MKESDLTIVKRCLVSLDGLEASGVFVGDIRADLSDLADRYECRLGAYALGQRQSEPEGGEHDNADSIAS